NSTSRNRVSVCRVARKYASTRASRWSPTKTGETNFDHMYVLALLWAPPVQDLTFSGGWRNRLSWAAHARPTIKLNTTANRPRISAFLCVHLWAASEGIGAHLLPHLTRTAVAGKKVASHTGLNPICSSDWKSAVACCARNCAEVMREASPA